MESLTPSSCINVLLGISRGLSHRTSIQKTLEEICVHVESFFSPRHLAFLLVEPDTGDLTFNHVVGEKAELVSGKKLRKGTGLAGWVAETGEPLLIEDTAQDPRFATQFLTAKTKGCSTVMVVPIKSGDLVYGVMELIDTRHGERFTQSNLADFGAIAEVTSVALERAYYFQAMRRMAETDQLTGVPNKRSFDRFMEREIEVCKRYGTPSSVVTTKIDNLRRLNEEYGPSSVDKIIQMLASILVEEVRKVDVTCRIASDTLAVIMPNTAKPAALDVSQRINAKIAQQSATRQMPYFSVTMDVISGVQDDVAPLIGICDTSRIAIQGFRKFRNVAANLALLLNEERQAMEKRQYYRKNVQLAGNFENPDTGETGDFLLENVSLNGVGFTTLLGHRLTRGALIKVRFRLDDSRRTEVTRLARVKYLSDRYVGCQFADQKSYDSDLGFYLMR
jgi:diguanylate cyclase (GGDEF)-like protein